MGEGGAQRNMESETHRDRDRDSGPALPRPLSWGHRLCCSSKPLGCSSRRFTGSRSPVRGRLLVQGKTRLQPAALDVGGTTPENDRHSGARGAPASVPAPSAPRSRRRCHCLKGRERKQRAEVAFHPSLRAGGATLPVGRWLSGLRLTSCLPRCPLESLQAPSGVSPAQPPQPTSAPGPGAQQSCPSEGQEPLGRWQAPAEDRGGCDGLYVAAWLGYRAPAAHRTLVRVLPGLAWARLMGAARRPPDAEPSERSRLHRPHGLLRRAEPPPGVAEFRQTAGWPRQPLDGASQPRGVHLCASPTRLASPSKPAGMRPRRAPLPPPRGPGPLSRAGEAGRPRAPELLSPPVVVPLFCR